MYHFIQGPMVWISLVVFMAGMAFQVFDFLSSTRVRENRRVMPLPLPAQSHLGLFSRIRLSLAGKNPVMFGVTTLFHALLFATPLLLLAHNILLDAFWGLSLFSFSEKATDNMTLLFLACLLFFLLRRVFVERVRMVTSFHDYGVWLLATAPFLTGYFAYHGMFDYKSMITLHMLSGELMIMAIPFTKFVHMLFFFMFRFLMESEYCLGSGRRTWEHTQGRPSC